MIRCAAGAAALFALMSSACGVSRPDMAAQPAPDTAAARIAVAVDDHLTRLSGYGYSGATLLSIRGQVVLRKGYGTANDSTGALVTPETVFDIGSLAKTFTAAAVLVLESRGRLSLDDSLSRFLDGVPADKLAITLRQLLSHTSGLDEGFPYENPTAEEYEEVSRDEAVRRILAMPMAAQPGAQFQYSNPGFILLAAVVERAAGEPFRAFVRHALLEPAGMRHTGFWGEDVAVVADDALARSYDEDGQTGNLRLRSGTTWFDLGGGEMVSTIGDLYRWAEALLSGRVLDAERVRRLWTAGEGRYGLGWHTDTTAHGTRWIHHGGDYVGFGAELAIYPDDGVVMANLANRRFGILGTRYAADRVIPRIVFGEPLRVFARDPFDPPPAWTASCGGCVERFAGVYRLPGGGRLVIREKGAALEVVAGGQEAVDLLMPAPAEEFAERRRISERSVAIIRGDTAALLAAVGPERFPRYRAAIARMLEPQDHGAFVDVTPIATVPAPFPQGNRLGVLRLRYERGANVVVLAWVQGRIQYRSVADTLLAPTPLRVAAPGSEAELVGWNMVSFRALRINGHPANGPAQSLEISSDGRRVRAERVPD